ncbi:MAG TPA: TraR/DksA C4-type zinc finger protein [Nitrospiraceae bacterium]|jgi:DnaK suppressor protein|nr:TraR/DksA C4-type zinc finger protein [Nitrospiraceae bacterium]
MGQAVATRSTERVARTQVEVTNTKYREIVSALQQQRSELLRLVTAKPLSEGIEITACPDLNDQATAEMDQHFMLSLKERERNLLKQIDDALARLAADKYGICEECGEEIPLRRLQARPMTTLCIACKTLQEEDEKIRH